VRIQKLMAAELSIYTQIPKGLFLRDFHDYIVQRCLAARWSIVASAFTRSVENTNWHLAGCPSSH